MHSARTRMILDSRLYPRALAHLRTLRPALVLRASRVAGGLALLAPVTFAAAVACGCSSAPGASATGNDGGTPESGVSVGPGLSGAAQASIGPIDVPAGVEKTVCIVKDLGNSDDLAVTGFTATLVPGSHHLIIYRTTATQEDLTPTPCSPFVGLVEGEAEPIVLINKLAVTWAFPAGVALEIPAHQMVRIEAHYINATDQDIQGVGTVTFQGTPKASAAPYQPADFLFWGTTQIDIPPSAAASVGPNFQTGLAGTHMISVTTHQHELGTGIQAWASTAAGDLSNSIADDVDWSNPSWRLLSPVVDFDGTNGLSYKCSWVNTTTSTVTFGESALDEMCFVGGYYYPSHGFDLCIDGECSVSASVADGGAGD
jgi:hypothetical protein